MRSIVGTGEPLGWSALVEPRHYRVTGVALEATRTLAIPSDELEAYGEAEPGFGLALMHKVLWVIGNRLRSTRIRLVAKRYDKEALAVRALLDQSAESLHVTSPLHKIPYLLEIRLTLDTHFVSSMILYPKYRATPIRVVRKPKPQWYGSQQYFDRLDYIYVYAGAVDEEDRDHHITRADRIRMFLERAAHHLRAGRNIVIAPEGACAYTENSPQPFKIGAFRLAAYVRPEPLIVPVAVANFDKRITRTRTAAVVFPPFRLSAFVPDPIDDEALIVFANHYTERFREYVREAIRLTALQTDSDRDGTKDQNNGRTSEDLGAGRA